MRHRFRIALLALLASIPFGAQAIAQQPLERVDVPPAVSAALHRSDPALESVTAWPVDWTHNEDLLVQAVYAFIGGEEFHLPGSGIASVALHPQGAFIVVHVYLPGDARCCPSGRSQVILARPAQQ